MTAAGDYSTRYEWRARVLGTPDAFGEKPATFRGPHTVLWGTPPDRSAAVGRLLESEHEEHRAEIRLRNSPAVKPRDVLYDLAAAEPWEIETAYAGDNEVVCTVVQR